MLLAEHVLRMARITSGYHRKPRKLGGPECGGRRNRKFAYYPWCRGTSLPPTLLPTQTGDRRWGCDLTQQLISWCHSGFSFLFFLFFFPFFLFLSFPFSFSPDATGIRWIIRVCQERSCFKIKAMEQMRQRDWPIERQKVASPTPKILFSFLAP